MSKEQLLTELRKLHGEWDAENAHIEADRLLLKYIDDDEVTEAFDTVSRWYA